MTPKTVTVTLDRTTVEMLRSQKRGLETWDNLMLRLGMRKKGWQLECKICGAIIETTDEEMSPAELARTHWWAKLYTNVCGEYADIPLGFICKRCQDLER
ncbi:MAG: hypothetical protein U9N01_04390 [Euryarchaeota archaeon]|nr:hypothetical protein [Euryarchaeota archaeon]